MKFLRDTYNGLYLVLLKPYMPKGGTIIALIAGVVIGLIWAYAISPVVYYDADPTTLQQSWQDEWVKLLADRNQTANANVEANITQLLGYVDDPVGVINRLIVTPGEEANVGKLEAIRPYADAAQASAATAPQPNLIGSILPFILAPLITVILAIIAVILYGMFIKPNLIDPLLRRGRGETTAAEVTAVRQQIQAQKQAETTLKTDYAVSNLGQPLMQRMSSYLLGRGNFDDSYSIEDENEKFLGECGASVSETFGVGDPPKATAIEAWLFDKDDFVRTITKVFVSEHAFNDPALRAKLELKGDLVLAQPGAVAILETASLRVQARIVEMEYGTGPQPVNSYFQKMTIELAAWRKDGVSVPVGAPVSTIPAMAPAAPQFMPPPVAAPPQPVPYTPPAVNYPPPEPPPAAPPTYPQPSYSPPLGTPLTGGGAPFSPPRPPAPPPRTVPDDDPFGGTGDFTPLS